MITYDGRELPAGVKVLDIQRPLLPPQELNMLSIEKKNGSFFYSKRSSNLVIDLEIMVTGKDTAEVRENLRNFAEFINADDPKPLIFHDEPDKYVEAILDGNSSIDNFYRLGKGTISMVVPDPYYYAVDDDTFQYSNTTTNNFTKKGNTTSFPTIEIRGTSNGGSFTVTTDNNSITFTGNVKAGDRLIINSELLTASIVSASGSVQSAIPYLDKLDFPVLVRGANSIRVEAKGGAVLENYFVRCNSRWL